MRDTHTGGGSAPKAPHQLPEAKWADIVSERPIFSVSCPVPFEGSDGLTSQAEKSGTFSSFHLSEKASEVRSLQVARKERLVRTGMRKETNRAPRDGERELHRALRAEGQSSNCAGHLARSFCHLCQPCFRSEENVRNAVLSKIKVTGMVGRYY